MMALLAMVAVLEAVVWLWRLRSGVGASRWQAAVSTMGVCATRMLWLVAGVQVTLAKDVVMGSVVYCGMAGVATWVVHGFGRGKA